MKRPTSKQPNPSKFHHHNRFLIPFREETVKGQPKMKANIPVRRPGHIIKSTDGKFTYEVQLNGALVKVQNQ